MTRRPHPVPGTDDRRPIAFLALVTVLSLPFFVAGAVFGTVSVGALDLPAAALMFVLPTVAAAILVRAGHAGPERLWRPPTASRVRWYAVAAMTMPIIGLVAYGISRLAGVADSTLPLSPDLIPGVVVAALIAAAGEELGWTGYATEPLSARFGANGAGIILGVFWALWHVVPLIEAGHDAIWIAGWFVGTVAARLIIVRLYYRSGRDVSTAIVMHATLNITAALTPGYGADVSSAVAGGLTAVVAWIAVRAAPSPDSGNHLE